MMIAMDGAYRYFSEALFSPVLGATPPPPMVSLSRGKTQRVLGFFVPDSWSDGSGSEAFGWIAITPEAIVRANLRDAMATLVHEMAHALDHAQTIAKGRKPSAAGYHPKSWFALMERLGLPGRAHSAAKIAVGHEVVEGGSFDVAFRAMPPALLLPFAATGTMRCAMPKAPIGSSSSVCRRPSAPNWLNYCSTRRP
jgi:hypothetical protein